MIDGVMKKQLRVIPDERGRLMECLRSDDELFMGEHNPLLVRVPPEVQHGWKCVSVDEAFIVNAPTEVYDYDEPDQDELPHDTDLIPYDWGLRLR